MRMILDNKQYLLLAFLLLISCSLASADNEKHIFSTGRIMEIDRCASAWLIKRYIDPQARFLFFEDGQLITKGTAFDTPDARFTRTHNMATFEVLMHYCKIKEPELKPIAEAIHEVEINYWAGRNNNTLSARMVLDVGAIIKANPEPDKCLDACFGYFDNLIKQ